MVKWFRPEGEDDVAEALALRAAYDGGQLGVVVPRLLYLELLNSASRRWKLDASRLQGLASVLVDLAFQDAEPLVSAVARWTSAGLTAYDACYVALAQELDAPLITADLQILELAPAHARSLTQAAAEF